MYPSPAQTTYEIKKICAWEIMDEKPSQRTVFRIVRIGKVSYKNLDFDAPTAIASEFNLPSQANGLVVNLYPQSFLSIRGCGLQYYSIMTTKLCGLCPVIYIMWMENIILLYVNLTDVKLLFL